MLKLVQHDGFAWCAPKVVRQTAIPLLKAMAFALLSKCRRLNLFFADLRDVRTHAGGLESGPMFAKDN